MSSQARLALIVILLAPLTLATTARGEPLPPLTSLSDGDLQYKVPKQGYFVLQRGDVQAVIADNRAIDNEILPGHRAGYSGLASIKHRRQDGNLFVPAYAGLNFEHIHDGTHQPRDVLFEPRRDPMELRIIDGHTVELYQAPTSTWGLESCLRYHMLPDATIEMTLECIPHRDTFQHGYIGLFWASYIHQPESLAIHFIGRKADGAARPRWIRAAAPKHGVDATHVGREDQRRFEHDQDFPLSLVFNRSQYRYTQPWYYGVSHGMAWVQMFRPRAQVRITQSPSGGGRGNPAWDFQYFIPNYQTGQRYQLVMRAMYVPFASREQIQRLSRPHREALGWEARRE